MSLDTIQGKLSRAEMKKIMAGGPCGFMDYLYHCTVDVFGTTLSGDVCRSDGNAAIIAVSSTLVEQGIPAGEISNIQCG